MSVSLNCLQHGLRFETIEKEDIGGTVRSYPRKKLVMTHPLVIPGYGKLTFREIQKEDLIRLWEQIAEKAGLTVRTKETVQRIDRIDGGGFEVTTDKEVYRSDRVVLAIGRRGVPRKLDVPGEDLSKVSYSLSEPDVYRNDRVLVVGGGDSAVEAALALANEAGTTVHLSYRREKLSRIKADNQARMQEAIAVGRIIPLWSTEVVRITQDSVELSLADGTGQTIENDSVFIFAGGVLPTKFLESCGVRIDTKFGEPA
jgi:thioredoxin reductase